jgi:hypothetical protein
MKKLILIGAVSLAGGILLAQGSKYQPLDVKTGLWESSWTMAMKGLPPIPPDVLEKMPPEQRARLEAAMGKTGSGTPMTRTNKSCLTKEQLEKNPFSQDQKNCKDTIISSTGSKMDIHAVCNENDMKMDLTIHIERSDSEHVTGKVESDTTGSGHDMTMNGTFKSKWLGAACGDVK